MQDRRIGPTTLFDDKRMDVLQNVARMGNLSGAPSHSNVVIALTYLTEY